VGSDCEGKMWFILRSINTNKNLQERSQLKAELAKCFVTDRVTILQISYAVRWLVLFMEAWVRFAYRLSSSCH
jgi:hypothetical protein